MHSTVVHETVRHFKSGVLLFYVCSKSVHLIYVLLTIFCSVSYTVVVVADVAR